MPAEVIWATDHYILKYSGCVVVEDSVGAYGEIVGSENFDDSRYAILDCREMTEVDYSPKDYDKHAAMAKSAALTKMRLRIGLVIPSEELEAKVLPFMDSVSKKFPHKWTRKIFRTYEEAHAWASSPADQD